MAERKTKRNARTQKVGDGFRLSREPVVRLTADSRSTDVTDDIGRPLIYGSPILFAIARDSHTIFVSWNIDWASIFQKTAPVDRQVHLRVYREDGSEETKVGVEPLAMTHSVRTPRARGAYRVEIGYYQPADFWHSVAISDKVVMPPNEIAEHGDVDLATIPFHLSFQQLLDLFGVSNETALASVMSQFQKRVLSRDARKLVSSEDKQILRKLGVSMSHIAFSQHAFDQIESDKLARRAAALLGFSATSPARARQGDWALAGS